jgi:endonuclease-8
MGRAFSIREESMPEGPEIHRAADKIHKALAGTRAEEVFFAFDELKEWEDELAGRDVLAVEPRGKAMLTRFEGGINVYSHNQLYGKWMVRNRGNMPDTNRQLRFAVHNPKKSALLYSASDIEVLTDDELVDQSYLAKLGPDPLLDHVSDDEVLARYEDDTFHRRQLAGLLLDQGFVGGIGNYLRSEILWWAGVHPREKLGKVDPDRRARLGEATLLLVKRSYDTGGITQDPDVAAAMKADGWKRRDYRYFVFGRAGKHCYRCDGDIVREEHAGRRVYRCLGCQPEP